MSKNEFTCYACSETFEKGWSDEEAMAEFGSTFPSADLEECSVVCDDCYKKIMGEIFQ